MPKQLPWTALMILTALTACTEATPEPELTTTPSPAVTPLPGSIAAPPALSAKSLVPEATTTPNQTTIPNQVTPGKSGTTPTHIPANQGPRPAFTSDSYPTARPKWRRPPKGRRELLSLRRKRRSQ